MAQLRKMLLVAGLLLGGMSQAWAQSASASRAQVYAVRHGGFTIPQVRLPNASVARRINRQVLALVVGAEWPEVNAKASAGQQLREANRACCYDKETRSWPAAGTGLTSVSYEVLLNRGYLLSLQFTEEQNSLIVAEMVHLNFDLRTGRLLRLKDLVADSPTQLSHRLVAAIDRRLWDELANVAAYYGDSSTIAYVASCYGLENWNTPAIRPISDNSPAVESGWMDSTDFALTPKALLLFYNVSMSRVNAEFIPDNQYTFPFGRIKPRGLLATLAKAAPVQKH